MTEVIFTLKVTKYVWDIILALDKLAKIPSTASMVESRLWPCRSPAWKNTSLEVKLRWKNQVSTSKNYSRINYQLSFKRQF